MVWRGRVTRKPLLGGGGTWSLRGGLKYLKKGGGARQERGGGKIREVETLKETMPMYPIIRPRSFCGW